MEYDSPSGGYILKTTPFLLDEIEVQDIDNISDWKLAETKFRLLKKRS